MDQPEPELSKIVLLNGQSVSPAATSNARWKLPFIQETMTKGRSCPPPVIAISETWLKSYITDAQIEIDDYQVYRSDRPDRVGGGCLLYIHDSLVVTETDCYGDRSNNMVMCYVKSCHTIFAAVYRPPGVDTAGFKKLLNQLQEKIDAISADNTVPDLYLLGDFNYPNKEWESGIAENGTVRQGSYLAEFINHNFPVSYTHLTLPTIE